MRKWRGTWWHACLVAGVAVAWYAAGLDAQQPRRPQPGAQTQLTAAGEMREEAMLTWPLPAGEEAYARIEGPRLKTFVNEAVAISRRSRDEGNKYWGRIAGTKYEDMTAAWLENHFRRLGMADIHRVTFPLRPQWFPLDWNVVASAAGKTLTFKSVVPALGSVATSGDLELEPVWLGVGTEADFIGRSVRGKAAVIQTMLAPGQMGHSAAFEGAIKRAEANGAAAVVLIWGYADNMAVWQGLGGYRIDTSPSGTVSYRPEPVKIPGVVMGFEDGKALRDLVGAGQPVKLKMQIKTEMREGLNSQSIYGTLPGTTDEKVYVLAHMDGYFDAASDNASGMAVMLGLAEHFAKVPAGERRRSIVFVGTAGHHVGSPNSPYLRDKGLLAKAALVVNCEHVAPIQTLTFNTDMRLSTIASPRRWWVHGSQRLLDITLNAYRTFGVAIVGAMDNSATGEMGSIDREAPSIQIIRSPENKHTDADIPERVSTPGLESVTRAFAKIITEVNKLALKDVQPVATTSTAAAQR